MGKTTIEWTATTNPDGSVTPGMTWNPTTGCTKVSQGCKNCYAKTLHDQRHRAFLAGKQIPPTYHVPFEAVTLHPDRLTMPLRWGNPRRVFVDSMSDLFHEAVPFDFIDRVFAAMCFCPRHTFQILTKRPERMREYLVGPDVRDRIADVKYGADSPLDAIGEASSARCRRVADASIKPLFAWPLPNVWLGVSAENQATADERIPLLLQTPGAVRFVSYEPALGPVNFTSLGPQRWDALCGWKPDAGHEGANTTALDWIIVGGESGKNARPFDVDWAWQTVCQCQEAGVACFVKQLGARPVEYVDRNGGEPHSDLGYESLRLRDSHGGDLLEWPTELRVREFPTPLTP